MSGNVQCLRDERALERDVVGIARGERLINGPADGTMIHDSVVVACHTHAVEAVGSVSASMVNDSVLHRLMTEAHTHETRDTVARHAEGTVAEHDAVARSRLTGDSHIFVAACQSVLQRDDTSDVEDDGTRPRHFLDAIAQRAGCRSIVVAIVGKARHVIDHSVAAADGITPIAFRSGKCDTARTERPYGTSSNRTVTALLIHAPIIMIAGSETLNIISCYCVFRCDRSHLFQIISICAEIEMFLDGSGARRPLQGTGTAVADGMFIVVGWRKDRSRQLRIRGIEDQCIDGHRRRLVTLCIVVTGLRNRDVTDCHGLILLHIK